MELTERQYEAIKRGRQALREAIRAACPVDLPRLWAAAVVSDFVGVCSASLDQGELIAVVNSELQPLGVELRRTQRH